MSQRADYSREEALLLWRGDFIGAGWLSRRLPQEVAATQAVGRITAENVIAARSVPHYAGAAMDGIAVRFLDTVQATEMKPLTLRLASAGQAPAEGEACIVDTGDALPQKADSIIMKEHIVLQDGNAIIYSPAVSGKHVRQIGEDIAVGENVLPAGHEIRPVDMAAILAAGVNRIKVQPRPRVAVIPTGSEIVDSEAPLPPGHIRDVNSYMLAALLDGWGAEVERHGVVPDDVSQIRAALKTMVAVSDMVVINAGTSTGSEDFTAGILREIGQVCCHGLAIRPGRPVIMAVVDGKPVIGLPGYPVSCMLTAELFVRDLVYEFQGKKNPERRTIIARLTENIKSAVGVEEFVRVVLAGNADNLAVTPLPRGASLISTLTRAQGFVRVAPTCSDVLCGDEVLVELF